MSMRVLLDESVPRQLAAALDAAGFSASPYPPAWKQINVIERSGRRQVLDYDRSDAGFAEMPPVGALDDE